MRLVTIVFSHYCDRARWGLERYGVAYRESGTFPLLHLPLVASLVGPGAASAGASRLATPVLVLDDGRVLRDSRRILRWTSATFGGDRLYPSRRVVEWEDELEPLGRATRRLAYCAGLVDEAPLRWLADHNLGHRHRALVHALLPGIRAGVRRALKAEPSATERLRSRLFEQLESWVQPARSPHLVGDGLTAADIALAVGMAPLVLPPEYGAALPPLDVLPSRLRELVLEVREHPVGARALATYRTARNQLDPAC